MTGKSDNILQGSNEAPPTIGYYIALAECLGWSGAALALRAVARKLGGIDRRLPFDGPRLLAWLDRAEARLRSATPPATTCETCCRPSWHPEDGRQRYCTDCGFADQPTRRRRGRPRQENNRAPSQA